MSRKKSSVVGELPGLVLTASRLVLAKNIADRLKEGRPYAAQMAAFVAADILDGKVLRMFDADTPTRRAADGIVDHASQALVMKEAWGGGSAARRYISILAARAAIVGGLNLAHYKLTGEVTKGNNYQRAANLSTAAFALAVGTSKPKVIHAFGVASAAINIATAFANVRDLGKKHPNGVRNL